MTDFEIKPTSSDTSKPIVLSDVDYAMYQTWRQLKEAVQNLKEAIDNLATGIRGIKR